MKSLFFFGMSSITLAMVPCAATAATFTCGVDKKLADNQWQRLSFENIYSDEETVLYQFSYKDFVFSARNFGGAKTFMKFMAAGKVVVESEGRLVVHLDETEFLFDCKIE